MNSKEIKENKEKKSVFSVLSPKDLKLETKHEIKPVNFSLWVRVLLQNWRQGTVGCKGRSDVSYSNKKPWKQKGTGRARAGSARSPLWIGGGVTFGPQPRTRKLKINKEIKKRVLNNLIWSLLENKKILLLNWEPSDKPKTSEIYKLLKEVDLHKNKFVLLVDNDDIVTQSAFSNLPNARILLFDEINAYDLSSGKSLVFLKKEFDKFKNMVMQWT